MGVIVFSSSLFVSGLVFGMTRGFYLSLCIIAVAPLIMVGTTITTKYL
jgi:hypothetical protein